MPHTDEDRLANFRPQPEATTVDEFLEQQLKSHELRNLYIARALPWGPLIPQARYEVLGRERALRSSGACRALLPRRLRPCWPRPAWKACATLRLLPWVFRRTWP